MTPETLHHTLRRVDCIVHYIHHKQYNHVRDNTLSISIQCNFT